MAEKLTPEEIKKALECCASGKNCEGCSLNCKAPTSKDILDLINRQQTEINEYKRNKKKIIFEIFERLKKLSYERARMKESGGLELITIVNIDDINKCLRGFLKEWMLND
jgi:hypothetical protein